MKRNKKLILSLSAFVLFAVLAVTVASLSFADENGSGGTQGNPTAKAAVSSSTRIDEIIANSNSTSADVDSVYHIVEIGSGSASGLQGLTANDGFKNLVIDPNSSDVTKLMASKKVEYTFIKASECTNDEKLEKLAKADLIYISNDTAAGKQYSKTNDIPEKAYDILHTAAQADYKPIIIDSKAQTEAIATSDTKASTNIGKLVDEVFNVDGKYYYTYPYVALTGGISDYFAHKGSMYIGINGSTRSSKWEMTKPTAENATPESIAKFLVVGDSTGTITTAVTAGATAYSGAIDGYTQPTGTTVYGIGSGSLKKAYNEYFDVYPNYIEFSYVDATGLTAIADLDVYDMVILESGALSSTTDLGTYYNTLQAAVYGKVHIIYDSSLASGGNDGQGSAGTGENQLENDNNYMKIFYQLVTSGKKETVRQSNVMLTNRNKINAICGSNSAASCKVIADLINASSYRGVGGAGNSSSMYTVLEIQPCYPIDEDVASYVYSNVAHPVKAGAGEDNDGNSVPLSFGDTYKKNYYIYPSNVLNNTTNEAANGLDSDGNQTHTVEYYAWELSEAKIAEALGTDVNHVKVVHMSTEELACSKVNLVGTYDMIYIGGNISARKDAVDYWYPYTASHGLAKQPGSTWQTIKDYPALPIYSMYSHSGDYHKIDASFVGSGGVKLNGSGVTTANYIDGTYYENVFAVENGNDITYNKQDELKKYIDAGYPVIVSRQVKEAYDAVKNNGYYQNSIDPDSNMKKVLAYADGKTNVLWNFDKDLTTDTDNRGGELGETLTGYVKVFTGDSRTNLVNLVNRTSQRPKLVVSQRPKIYDQNDSNSVYKQGDLISFKTEVDGLESYTVNMYIDDNGNSVFESSEKATVSGSNGSYSLKLSSDFFGPLYWKIEVTGTKNGKTVSVYDSGLSYVSKTTPDPQTVKILQILPESGSGTYEKENNLYFCTTCNKAYEILEFNPVVNTGTNFFTDQSNTNPKKGTNVYTSNYNDNLYTKGTATTLKNKYFGKHEHHFGIWYYDSALGMDDLTTNLASSLDDLYDYDLDIVYPNDFSTMCSEVKAAYSGDVPTEAEMQEYLLNASQQEKIISDLYNESNLKNANAEIAALKADLTELNNNIATDEVKYNALRVAYTEGNPNDKLINAGGDDDFWKYNGQTYQDWFKYKTGTDGKTFTEDRYVELKDAYYKVSDAKGRISTLETEIDNLTNNLTSSMSLTELESELDKILDTEVYNYIINLTDATPEAAQKYIASIKYNKDYFDVFNVTGSQGNLNEPEDYRPLRKYYKAYNAYMTKKDAVLSAQELYDRYMRYVCYYEAYAEAVENGVKNPDGLDWINKYYDTIVIGPSEWFANEDITGAGLDALERFVDNNGTTLLFHDTLSWSYDGGAHELTARLRGKLGADAYGNMKLMNADGDYFRYTSQKDPTRYYTTNLNVANSDGTIKNSTTTWRSETSNSACSGNTKIWYSGNDNGVKFTNVCFTDFYKSSDNAFETGTRSLPYRYAETRWSMASSWSNSGWDKTSDSGSNYGTDKASQNNEGIVTLFPFRVAKEINISPTHAQAYAADIEDTNMTVWYSMAGGTNVYDNKRKEGSSLYAADPRDGMDNYFIYSYGNVSYCGTGHTKVCGLGKDNNDERMLYINIISNSVRKSAFAPQFLAYDYDSASGENATTSTATELKKIGDDYVIEIGTTAGTDADGNMITVYDDLKFAFALIGGDANIKNAKNVKVFFDLNGDMTYTNSYTSQYSGVNGDVLISEYDSVTKNVLMLIAKEIAYAHGKYCNTTLYDRYFMPYNMEYTYIVITADDMEPIRIKIKLKELLFDLN